MLASICNFSRNVIQYPFTLSAVAPNRAKRSLKQRNQSVDIMKKIVLFSLMAVCVVAALAGCSCDKKCDSTSESATTTTTTKTYDPKAMDK